MSLLGSKRRKKSRLYEILIIPHGDGGLTKSIKAGGMQLAMWGVALAAMFFLIYYFVFRYTPLGVVLGADPALRSVADSVENDTQRRLRALAEEIAVLKDYNLQLRKALGERPASSANATTEGQTAEPTAAREARQELGGGDFPPPTSTVAQPIANVEGLRASFPLLTPINGVLTRGFDREQRHFGIDLAAKQGTPVHAAAEGYVVFAGWTYEDGNVVIISHGTGYVTVYKHNSSILKTTGTLVKRGELIALVGNTGVTSTGPHLHFEVLKDGLPQDPQEYMLTAPKL